MKLTESSLIVKIGETLWHTIPLRFRDQSNFHTYLNGDLMTNPDREFEDITTVWSPPNVGPSHQLNWAVHSKMRR
jgi:hypothetical protein